MHTIPYQHNITRMEGKGGGDGCAGGEVRRVHIIYFLSRLGRIEQPHLIRVHHRIPNGVHLRDVKRWLSDLRGKDMPNSFSWSYKRGYKMGYVWQDLTDDDLITPFSDNEYVLKGSAIPLIIFDSSGSSGEKQKSSKLDKPQQEALLKDQGTNEEHSRPFDLEVIKDESNEKDVMLKYAKLQKFSSSSSILFDKSNNESKKKSSSSSNNNNNKSKSIFRNLMNCGVVETKDSTYRVLNRKKHPSHPSTTPSHSNFSTSPSTAVEIQSRHDTFNGSFNVQHYTTDITIQVEDFQPMDAHEIIKMETHVCTSPTVLNQKRNYFGGVKKPKLNESRNKRKVAYKYNPVTRPNCSQCGKPFKPEKLHSHMKSCRGLRKP